MIIDILWYVIYIFLAVGFIACFIRLARGPNLPDRIISLDLISIMAIGFFVAYAVQFNQTSFMDVAIILAMITFLGTVAFAYYLERRV
ncbi:MAG: cation:proton antiporter [Anaerolineaceae bacterium]|nr:cation:proton antiporter [Anaerolineaceae bacterium]